MADHRQSELAANIVIAGAGIGGLTCALGLAQRGIAVHVLEQSERLEAVGAGIQLSPNACYVFNALGVLPALRARAFEPERIEMRVGRSGRQVMSIPLRGTALARWGQPYLHIHRADLQAVLVEALAQRAPGALQTGCAVVGYGAQRQTEAQRNVDADTDGVAVHLADGRVLHGSLLIGADGLHSRVRDQMLGAEQPRFTGNIAWRAVVPTDALGAHTPPPSACVWVGAGRHAVTYRLRGGTLANFVGVVESKRPLAENWSQTGTREQVLADFAGFHPVIQACIEHAPRHYCWALYDRAPLSRWVDRRVALLGDACHPMLPFVAQGAAQAIEDAWVLADSIANSMAAERGDTKLGQNNALNRYTDKRFARASRVQAEARANQKRFHRPGWMYWPVWLLARLWPRWFHKRQDWLYGHDVTADSG